MNKIMMGTDAVKVKESREIEREMVNLGETVENLGKLLNTLGNILAPVLSSNNPGSPSKEGPLVGSETALGGTIKDNSVKLAGQIACVQDWIERIQL